MNVRSFYYSQGSNKDGPNLSVSGFDLEGKGVVFSQGFTGSEKYLFFGEYAAI